MALSNYFVPPLVEAWPMFLMYYTGAGGVIHFLVLIAMLCAIRGKQTIHEKKEENSEPPKDAAAA